VLTYDIRRDIEPRYGFYVLNRSGMHDYVHPIYPWDDIQRSKPYLLFCSYPDYTSAVLAGKPLPLAPPTEPPGPHAARKAFRKSIIGLWTSEKETHGASMAPAIIRYVDTFSTSPITLESCCDRVLD
jgi:hypothetical protein